MASEQLHYDKWFTVSEFTDALNIKELTQYKNGLQFINPLNDGKQGYNLLRIVYKVITTSTWSAEAFMTYVERSKECQMTEKIAVDFITKMNLNLNVFCIHELKSGTRLKKLYEQNQTYPWIILYKHGLSWKLAVHQEKSKFFPLFKTEFVDLLGETVDIVKMNDLENTCVSLQARRQSESTSRRSANPKTVTESEKRRRRENAEETEYEDRKLARAVQNEYFNADLGNSKTLVRQANKNPFEIRRYAPRNMKNKIESLERKIPDNEFQRNVRDIVVRELGKPKSKSRRQSKAPKATVVLDDSKIAEFLQKYYKENPTANTPSRYKNKQ